MERQPQSCPSACLLAEAEVPQPGKLGRGKRETEAGVQEGGTQGRGLHLLSNHSLGERSGGGEGPTENKAEPGPARKASCH